MSNAHVHPIPILPMGMVNAFLVEREGHCMLVDAGLPNTERAVEKALTAIGRTWSDIAIIVVTHAHVDHAGNAARLRMLSGAPLVAHEADVPYLERRRPMGFCPTGLFGRIFWQTRLIIEPYEPFTPDIVLGDGGELDLRPYGFEGRVVHTPGHTAGSLSVSLGAGDALVGDLVASGILLGGIVWKGRAKQPPFEDDPLQVASALSALLDEGHTRFYLGHGGPLPAREVRRHVQRLHAQRRGVRRLDPRVPRRPALPNE